MNKERLSIPQDPEYFEALGLALVCFSRMEWGAVWCCETFEESYPLSTKKKMTTNICKDLFRFVENISDKVLKESIKKSAIEFSRAIKKRNEIFHAKPATKNRDKQRLFSIEGQCFIEIDEINKFSDLCAKISFELYLARKKLILYHSQHKPMTITSNNA